MSYVDNILQPGERIVYRTRPHWIVYVTPAILAILAVAIEGWAIWGLASTNAGVIFVMRFVLPALLAGAAIVTWFPALLKRFTTELAVTDKRIIYKTGLIRRHTIEMHMEKVESVNVDQSILGRILDYGTVTIHGTGGGLEPLPSIGEPIAFRNHVTAT
jgi:uncharacterized membrane protein YdbT with pleckstrin-like domain